MSCLKRVYLVNIPKNDALQKKNGLKLPRKTIDTLYIHIQFVTVIILIKLTFVFRLLGNCPNTYTFSKALAEGLVNEQMDKLPIIIVRPAVGM